MKIIGNHDELNLLLLNCHKKADCDNCALEAFCSDCGIFGLLMNKKDLKKKIKESKMKPIIIYNNDNRKEKNNV